MLCAMFVFDILEESSVHDWATASLPPGDGEKALVTRQPHESVSRAPIGGTAAEYKM